MKLTKNPVTIVSSLWTRYSIKKIICYRNNGMFPCIIQFCLVFLQPLMNKSISSVNLNLELDFVSTF